MLPGKVSHRSLLNWFQMFPSDCSTLIQKLQERKLENTIIIHKSVFYCISTSVLSAMTLCSTYVLSYSQDNPCIQPCKDCSHHYMNHKRKHVWNDHMHLVIPATIWSALLKFQIHSITAIFFIYSKQQSTVATDWFSVIYTGQQYNRSEAGFRGT